MNAWSSISATPGQPAPLRQRRGGPGPLRARDRILAIVRAMLVEGSYDSLSLEAVATAAGVTRRTVYNQFADKAELYRTSRQALLTSLAADLAAEVPPRMALADGLGFFAELANDVFADPRNIELTRSRIRDAASQPWLAVAHDRQIRQPLCRALETYLLRQLPRGRARDDRAGDDRAGAIAGRLVTLLEAMATGPQLVAGGLPAPLAHGEERAMVAAGYARLLAN
jgi:AcrR family transcriptional regulator